MARYINADDLTKKIFPIGMIENGNYAVNAKAVKVAIESTPTADVVEVVRCKDCEDFTKAMIGGDLEFLCKNAKGMIDPAPDKYCSYGTPKERGEGDA